MSFYMPAEWHPHERCWMAWPCHEDIWPHGIDEVRHSYAAVANAISLFEPVTMVVRPTDAETALAFLGPKTQLLEMELNDSWMRDMGPTFVIDDQGNKAGVNWVFNGWVKYPHDHDKLVTPSILRHLNLPCIDYNFVNEGGAIHVDGEGTVLLTETVQLNNNRNPNTDKEQIESLLQKSIGASKCIWFPRGLVDDDTDGHVDELACFISPGVVLALTTDDKNDSNYDILQTNLEILRSSSDAKGRSLEVRTIHKPADEKLGDVLLSKSYINFYIANAGIIMPMYGDENADHQAYETIQKCFPERKVMQIDCREIVTGGGNIHCITQQEPKIIL